MGKVEHYPRHVSFRISLEMSSEIESAAKKKGVNKTDLIRDLLTEEFG